MNRIKHERAAPPIRVTAILFAAMVLALLAGCAPISDTPGNPRQEAGTLSLTPMEIYAKLAPSVAFIETEIGTGSGPLIELEGKKYILTNAHVMWPFNKARIVFPDGEEYLNVPLVQTDQLVDLALVGPIDTQIEPLELSTEQNLAPGEFTYLIGYPGEGDFFPQPAITRGILSLTRYWPDLDNLRYYQTDAAGAGGQSGGILVSNDGEVIGISGMLFAEAFILSSSSMDIVPRIEEMLTTADTGPIRGVMPERLNKRKYRGALENYWDTEGFVVDTKRDTDLEIEAYSDSDLGLVLFNSYGEELTSSDSTFGGTEVVSTTVKMEGPQFLLIEQYTTGEGKYTLDSTHRFEMVDDPDDGQVLELGQTVEGNIDYPGDADWFVLPLRRGERVVVQAESTAVDTSLGLGPAGEDYSAYVTDDDSGRGLLGSNSRVEYRAKQEGDYYVIVRAFGDDEMGSFILKVSEATE